MADDDVFADALDSVSQPVHLTTKAEIAEYFKDTAGEKWTRAAAEFVSGTTDRRSKEYRSAQRHFQGGREYSTPRTAADRERWASVGEQLPAIGRDLKEGQESITITVKGEQSNGRGGIRERIITITLSGSDAYDWVNNPDFAPIWSEYGFDFDEAEGGEYGLENVTVSAV